MKILRAAILAVIAVLAGCSLSGVTEPGTTTTGAVPVTTKQFEYGSGTYLFQTNDAANRGKTFLFSSDAVSTSEYPIEVTVNKIGGGTAGGFGVIFARQDADNFWFADIDTASNYAVGKVASGAISYLTSSGGSTWVGSVALNPGLGVSNTIKVAFDGAHQYTLSLNGTQVFQFTDTGTVPSTCAFGFNVGVLSTENFPSAPVAVSFTVIRPTDLTFPLPGGTSANIVPFQQAVGVRR